MGLKDWLARSVAGPQSYGDMMGRQAREFGAALANTVFLSHGSRPDDAPATVFDTLADMESAGLKPRYEPPSTLDITSMTGDEKRLLKNLTTAMMAYAWAVNSNCAMKNMQSGNADKFHDGLGPSLNNSMVTCGLFENVEAARGAVSSYLRSMDSASMVLNQSKPASRDLLEHFIIKAVEASEPSGQYGFVRSGETGLDTIAVSLVMETLRVIVGATQRYRW